MTLIVFLPRIGFFSDMSEIRRLCRIRVNAIILKKGIYMVLFKLRVNLTVKVRT